jgi:hypothetical protein
MDSLMHGRRALIVATVCAVLVLVALPPTAMLGATLGTSRAARVVFLPALPGRELAVYMIPCTAWRPGWIVVRSRKSQGAGPRYMRIPLSRRFDWDWLEPGNARLLSLNTFPPCPRRA